MIASFEHMVKMHPDWVFFTFVDAAGHEQRYTYKESRLLAASLAHYIRGKGVHRGDAVAIDLPNCPAFVFLLLAAAYGSFSLLVLNNRLAQVEKFSRLLDVKRTGTLRVSLRIDKERAASLMRHATEDLDGTSRRMSGRRNIRSAQQDAEEEIVHFAEHEAHLFTQESFAVVMFTSGTTGKAKAGALTWDNLIGAADAANRSLAVRGQGLWQAVLPLYHVGGLQVVVRSIRNNTPFRLYEHFDAARVLSDVPRVGATHISVVDKMLQDMLNADPKATLLRAYQCILLGGAALNAGTIDRLQHIDVRVYASYGMTETSSQVANECIGSAFDGGLRLLSGYQARIVDADDQGFGRLALRGPGVFANYLNATAAFTVDGFFLTGDTAAFVDGRLYVKERTSDMFVSGGENIYPAEISAALTRLPGVSDAYVFGAPSSKWGRRPVAFVECTQKLPSGEALRSALVPHLSKFSIPDHIFVCDELPRTGIGKVDRASIEHTFKQRLDVKRIVLYHIKVPFKQPFSNAQKTLSYRESLIVELIDGKGRSGLGECVAFESDWYLPETIAQDKAALRYSLAPKVISDIYLHPREFTASLANTPELASFPLACGAIEPALWDLYGKIVHKPLWQLIQEEYARLNGDCLSVASVCADSISAASMDAASMGADSRGTASMNVASMNADGMSAANMNVASMNADGMSTADMSAGTANAKSACVAVGAVVGLKTLGETLEAVRRSVEAGYQRVKLKVAPGSLEAVRAVREQFPSLLLTLDANQSLSERDMRELRAFDALDIAWIEEPISLVGTAFGKAQNPFAKLANLQRSIVTPICVDESFTNAEEAFCALEYPQLRCFSVKVGKFGGVESALKFIAAARASGREVWMGGMYDTGISKRLHAAFQTLPELIIPGDIGAVSRYFDIDITDPPYTAERGVVVLNHAGHEDGLGCALCRPALEHVLVDKIVIE